MIAGFFYGLMVGTFAGVWIAYFTRSYWSDAEKSRSGVENRG